ncbi:ComEC/Rec2 family competence protein [Bifidobacterium sp. ESL0790]|uniref:ComEC/Rec2 family competence protein n=1 Tax=Bifidobacterium sp. ESL0790 TaxID=2983233 RepID=UPI0023FA0E3F|nr:ComEC/Rec2 family competence protein [Bifidobacterium sp. ESL0790]WEV71768.1 ComEC/Rec2 family competence protein [Bifidobacterium sp. ESL0790]
MELLASVPKRSFGLWALLLMGVMTVSCMACIAGDYMEFRDSAVALARSGESDVGAEVRLTSPITASNSFKADCQANARLKNVRREGVVTGSNATLTVYADQPTCGRLNNGETITLSGKLEEAKYGVRPLSLTADDGPVRVVARAPPVERVISGMQRSFFAVTEGLSEQGRVLVPGLTIGLLGQDFMGPTTREPVNGTFATLLERHFKDSGIMHLMAVSGGHFALIGSLVARCCALVLLPRQPVATLTMLAYAALASAMYPSDSVLRALIMGVIVGMSRMVGRRPQALSALSWTTIITLLVEPRMARSFGFALSCASVLGIVLCASRLAEWLGGLLPGFLAEGVAVTLAAQLFTLPIQVLMDPQLPLLSVPANLIVAPFVDFSTLTGLAALLFAGIAPRIAFCLAWASSCGTVVMCWCADTIGSRQSATMPWAGGVFGSLAVVAAEVAVVLLVRAATRWVLNGTRAGESSIGSRVRPDIKAKAGVWMKETEQMFEHLHPDGDSDCIGPD